jgi:hypothetical protein
MQPAQEILLRLPNKRLPPLFTDILQHLRRIIVTIPLPGFHNIILGRQNPHFLPNLAPHGFQSRFPRVNSALGKLPGSFLPGTLANQQFPVLPDHHPRNIRTIQSFHALFINITFSAFPAMFFP